MSARILFFVLFIHCVQVAVAATRLTGIVYGIQGGESDTAKGELRIAAKGKVYRLAFQKPYQQKFSAKECDSVGAIWTIDADVTDSGEGKLLEAKCDGKRDELVQVGALAVSSFFNLVGNGDFKTAYAFFSTAYKSSHTLPAFIDEFGKLKVRSKSLSYQCLEVERKLSESSIELKAGKECGVTEAESPASSLVFHIERENTFLQVQIVGIDKVSE